MAIENLITDHLDLWTAAARPKSSAGRGSNSKLELTGIKKLRELILELAVRGKLVPQDPSDEPASVLLERIAAEKGRLVKEGKIKRPKALPEIGEEEKPFELPDGWEWSMLAEIAEINPRNESDDTVDASFVPMSLISTAYNGQHEFEARKWGEIKKGFTHFSNGDIGVAKITPCFENSKAAVFRGLINGLGAGTTELHIARPYTDYVSAFFILLNIKSPIYLKKGEAGMTGTAGQKRLAKDFFSFYPLPIPPFAEQRRIVAKVDELMALCDQLEQRSESQLAAHQTLVEALLATLTDSTDADELAQNWARLSTHFDTLFTTEASIDALKQTILQLAVMGKLAPQDPSDEPASALLERIAAKKAQLVKEKKIKKEKPLPAISEDEKPFELPKGWEWCRLGALMPQFQNGASSRGDSGGIPITVLRLADIKDWKVSLADTRELSIDSKSIDKYLLEKGDTLIIRVNGSSDIVGRFIGCDENYDAIYCDHFIRMRFLVEVFNTRYLSLLGSSNIVRSKIADLFISTAGQKTVNQGHISSIVLPLPSITEQNRIVAKVDELRTLCDQLKSRLQTSQQTQLALAESLVEGALA
ncbi:restriction endonuclease subunit S [Aeromonas media]|uniref:restriction endonuclease subunit S n=1 Tax=Aeromonas media TaxID=651 RepID=UPI002282B0D8|nr:restriction endonuclease subunit S [Aeromonas media]MCY9823600.1 restriction endonuclease subunit S [Aeromonas media]